MLPCLRNVRVAKPRGAVDLRVAAEPGTSLIDEARPSQLFGLRAMLTIASCPTRAARLASTRRRSDATTLVRALGMGL
jgi:hypothetical protein